MMETALSLVVLAAIALTAGAIYLWRRGDSRRQAMLMLVLAVVMAINVAILTWPAADGAAPIAQRASIDGG